MRLKDGFQQCPRCQGKGCWRCRQKGYLLQCPTCGMAELEFMSKADDGTYQCMGCGTQFDKAGEILSLQEPKAKPKKLTKVT